MDRRARHFFVGILFFFPFPSWQKLVGYASAATVVSYGLGPIVLLRLRGAVPDTPHRSFRLWRPRLMAALAFVAANLVMFWAGFAVVSFMLALLGGVFILYAIYFFAIKGGMRQPEFAEWRYALWLVPYFGGMGLLSYCGPTAMGGIGVLNIYWDMAAITLLSLFILKLALATSMPAQRVAQNYRRILGEWPAVAGRDTVDRGSVGLRAGF